MRAELHALGIASSQLNLGVHILGLIGTDSNLKRGEKLVQMGMPVTECAAEMICAIDARMETAYVPQFLSPYSTLVHFLPWLGEQLIFSEYLGARLALKSVVCR